MTQHSDGPVITPRGATIQVRILANPLDFIADDHMREREVCELIDRVASGGSVKASDRARMRAFLCEELPRHLEDEEMDLFPMMLKRCDPDEEIGKVIDKLQSDHGHALADASGVAALIEQTQQRETALTKAEVHELKGFAHHARHHLTLENAVVLPIARARLTDGDLSEMRRNMMARRGLVAASGRKT